MHDNKKMKQKFGNKQNMSIMIVVKNQMIYVRVQYEWSVALQMGL